MGNSFITMYLNTSKKLALRFPIIYKISNVISNVVFKHFCNALYVIDLPTYFTSKH